jgi:hypothetical protein
MLCVNPWVIHRSKEIFGDDANEFNPERWLGPNSKGLNHYFIPVRSLTHPFDQLLTNYNYLLVSSAYDTIPAPGVILQFWKDQRLSL